MSNLLLFTVEGRTFASGVFWQPLSSTAKGDGKAEALRVAAQLNANVAIWHPLSPPQVGLGTLSKSASAKKVAAAAAIVSKTISMEVEQPKAFLSATRIPDGRWLYVAQREGILLADGDQLSSEDEIRARLLSDLSLGTWPLIFAPAQWGIPNSTERTFESYLPRKKGRITWHKWWELLPLNQSYNLSIILGGVLVVLLIAGGVAYKIHLDKKAAAERAQLEAEQAIVPIPTPWVDQPQAMDVVRACGEAYGKLNAFASNWDVIDSVCMDGTLTLKWNRGAHGWIEHFQAAQPTATLSPDGTSASVAIPVMSPKPAGIPEPLPKAAEHALAMLSSAQKVGFPLVLNTNGASAIPMPGVSKPATAAPNGWKEIKWTVTGTPLAAHVIIEALSSPGLRVSKISENLGSQPTTFSIEGAQYVQP